VPVLLYTLPISCSGLKSSRTSPRISIISCKTAVGFGAVIRVLDSPLGLRVAVLTIFLLAYPDLGHLPTEEAPAKAVPVASALMNYLTTDQRRGPRSAKC